MVAFCDTVSFVPNVSDSDFLLANVFDINSFQVGHCRTFQPSGLFVARVDMQGSTPVCWFLMLNLYLGHLILSSFMLALSTLLVSCRATCYFHG